MSLHKKHEGLPSGKEQYDKILLDFIAESRRMIEKKTFNITVYLKDLKEENERIIIKYCKRLQSSTISTTPPNEYSSKQLHQSLNNIALRHSETPKGNLKTRNDALSSQHSKTNSNNNSNSHSKAVINTHFNSSLINSAKDIKKDYSHKNPSKEKRRIEVAKKPFTNYSNKEKFHTITMHSTGGFRNTDLSLNGYDKKQPKKSKPVNKSISNKNGIKDKEMDSNRSSFRNKGQSQYKELSSKENAIKVLLNSQVLFLKEKMFFWYTTPSLQGVVPKNKIFEDYKTLIQNKTKDFEKKTIFKSSAIATNCLNFIKNSDEEDLLLLGKKAAPGDLVVLTGELKLIYAFLGIDTVTMTTNEMIVNLYEKILKEHKITSIKQLISTVICSNANRNLVNKHLIENLIKQYDSLFNSAFYLQISRTASFLNYILKELAYFVLNYDYNSKQHAIYQDIITKIDIVQLFYGGEKKEVK